MNDFGAVYSHSTLLYVKEALPVAHHFALGLRHLEESERPAVNGLQCTGKPAAGKMAPGGIASAVLGKPPGDMVAGRASDATAAVVDGLWMDNAQPAILVHDGAHFQLGLDRFYFEVLRQQGVQTVVYGLFRGAINQADTFLTECILKRLLQINIIMMTMNGNRLTGENDLIVPPFEFTFPVKSDHTLPVSNLKYTAAHLGMGRESVNGFPS